MLSSGGGVSHPDSSTASPQAVSRRRKPILVIAAIVAGMMAATGAHFVRNRQTRLGCGKRSEGQPWPSTRDFVGGRGRF
jgi:hypothetical protein